MNNKIRARRYVFAAAIMLLIWILWLLVILLELKTEVALLITGATLANADRIIGFFFGKEE